jgi:hypothetical protein
MCCCKNFEVRITIMANDVVDIGIDVSPAAQALAVDLSGVPNAATVGTPYSGAIVASGGVPPYSFTDVSVNNALNGLPPGVVLNPDGTLSGTPTLAGIFDAAVDVADSATPPAVAKVAVRAAAKVAPKVATRTSNR